MAEEVKARRSTQGGAYVGVKRRPDDAEHHTAVARVPPSESLHQVARVLDCPQAARQEIYVTPCSPPHRAIYASCLRRRWTCASTGARQERARRHPSGRGGATWHARAAAPRVEQCEMTPTQRPKPRRGEARGGPASELVRRGTRHATSPMALALGASRRQGRGSSS